MNRRGLFRKTIGAVAGVLAAPLAAKPEPVRTVLPAGLGRDWDKRWTISGGRVPGPLGEASLGAAEKVYIVDITEES